VRTNPIQSNSTASANPLAFIPPSPPCSSLSMTKETGKGNPKDVGDLEQDASEAFHRAMRAPGIASRDSHNHRSDSARRDHDPRPDDGAAAAAPRDDNAGDDGTNATAVEEQLILRVKHYFGDTHPSNATLTAVQARRLLEASSGDLDLAAGFYWDEYFANTANHGAAGAPSLRSSNRDEPGNNDDEYNDDEDDGEDEDDDEQEHEHDHSEGIERELAGDEVVRDMEAAQGGRNDMSLRRSYHECDPDDPIRRIRRRLGNQLPEAEEQDEEDEPMENNDHEDNLADEDDDNDDDDDDDDDDARVPERAVPADEGEPAHNVAGSVSVSDDEAGSGGIWRMAGRRAFRVQPEARSARNIHGGTVPNERNDADDSSSSPKRSKSLPSTADSNNHEEEECLSDNDWLLNDDIGAALALRIPTVLLWGLSNAERARTEGDAGNVVDPEEEDEDDDGLQGDDKVGIPPNWLSSGFHMSECATGLTTKAPEDDEAALLQWRQQRNNSTSAPSNGALPPFHCLGITALLSIVTAMIYTGASVQGNMVDCSSSRKPFVHLSEKERAQEFESRLVDALTALIHIALKSSTDRKKRALEKEKPGNADDDGRLKREQMIRRKLRLCPTCRWTDDGTGEPKLPQGKNAGQRVRIRTSYTSVSDLRAYVLSNMRSFTGRGGCALLLETIVTIHGPGSISRMIRKARRVAGLSSTGNTNLASCGCSPLANSTSQASGENAGPAVLDPRQLTNKCMSNELLSLLLTGTVHSKLSGWSTGGLGFGLLSNSSDKIGSALARPDQPVWVVREDSGYSVLWLNRSKSNDVSVAQVDKPGDSFYLLQWRGLFGIDIKRSGMRVITARQTWTPPIIAKVPSKLGSKKSILDCIVERRRNNAHVISSDEHDEEAYNSRITDEEMDQVKVHPEDQKYYPGAFKRWRYDVVELVPTDHDQKMPSVKWTPFYKLTERQQQIVETKLAPKISSILWTRWPKATIDSFTSAKHERTSGS
jgi:hypothetical protein